MVTLLLLGSAACLWGCGPRRMRHYHGPPLSLLGLGVCQEPDRICALGQEPMDIFAELTFDPLDMEDDEETGETESPQDRSTAGSTYRSASHWHQLDPSLRHLGAGRPEERGWPLSALAPEVDPDSTALLAVRARPPGLPGPDQVNPRHHLGVGAGGVGLTSGDWRLGFTVTTTTDDRLDSPEQFELARRRDQDLEEARRRGEKMPDPLLDMLTRKKAPGHPEDDPAWEVISQVRARLKTAR